MAPTTTALIDALDPRVTAFQAKAFTLAEDLEWLDRLREQKATVAVTLHGARILEVLAREALKRAGLAVTTGKGISSPAIHDILKLLLRYDLLSRPTYRLVDRLRDLGNNARHVLRKVTVADADLGYAIVLRGLHWFFCEFPQGPKLKCLVVHMQSLDSLLPFNALRQLELLESADLDPETFLAKLELDRSHCPLLVSPVLAAALIEKLLDGNRVGQAEEVLNASLRRYPEEIRLRQLKGLLLSRTGRLEEACNCLDAIESTESAADEETQGILAGTYKRRADQDLERRDEWLGACHEWYESGWQLSQESNTYLGINTAATALWLGISGKTAPIAAKIRNLLESRQRALARSSGEMPRRLNCWDQLTLAEAYLLLKQWDKARQGYHEAVERFPKEAMALKVAREQANRNLAAMERTDLIGTVFPG